MDGRVRGLRELVANLRQAALSAITVAAQETKKFVEQVARLEPLTEFVNRAVHLPAGRIDIRANRVGIVVLWGIHDEWSLLWVHCLFSRRVSAVCGATSSRAMLRRALFSIAQP